MRLNSQITAYIALGANLGNRQQNIRNALKALAETPGIRITRVSSLLENPAQGMGNHAPPFLNAVAEIRTTLGSHALLHRMIEIERSLGRERSAGAKWTPRPIDLDLLLYGDQIISSQELIVPHPLMHERRFVLEPLCEIAPDVVHPTLQMTIAGLLESLNKADKG